jgi:hypothetical protein
MGTRVLSRMSIKLPDDLKGRVSEADIMNKLVNGALNRMEYYRTRCMAMEEKYGVDFDHFQSQFTGGPEEVFDEGDDLSLWEGYFQAFQEWKSKYENLRTFLQY